MGSCKSARRRRRTPFGDGRRPAAFAVALAAVAFACTGQPEAPEARGSVILISVDTLRADHLSCYGYHRPTSPFIDSLAARGTLFENAIVQVPGTLPSHMSMLTGLLPAEHDVFPPDGVLSDDIPLVAELAAAAGVRTAGFTEGGYMSGRYGFSRGFAQFDDSSHRLNSDFEDGLRRGLGFLETIKPRQPFFLFLHTYAVHDPYLPPLPYAAWYLGHAPPAGNAERPPVPAGYDLVDSSRARMDDRRARHVESREFVSSVLPPGAPLPTGPELSGFNRGRVAVPHEAVAVYEALYDATINYVDDLLREFFDRLEVLGLADSTTVIITSDHGEEFLEHGRLLHEQVYHECLHVPLIVVGPDVAGGHRVSSLVMAVDLAPTVLDLLGVDPPGKISGRTLTAAFDGRNPLPLDARDAHAAAVVDPAESVYRLSDDRLHQLVVHSAQLLEADPWVEKEIDLHPVSSRVRFKAMSYDRPRQVDVRVDGAPSATLDLTPEWRPFEVSVPDDGARHIVTMTADGCVSPASLGRSVDTRCLAFRLSGFESRRTELFDLAADPRGAVDLSPEHPELAASLLDGLRFFHRRPVAAARKVPLDKATEEQLRALGYLE